MDLSQEIDIYNREPIDSFLSLHVSTHALELKLRASEEAQRRLRDHYFDLLAELKEKDEIIERARAESNMNAQALKKFVEANHKLATECSNLLGQCNSLERECSLYAHDQEALMDFGKEADERAKDANIRVHELEDEVKRLLEELQFYKRERPSVDTSSTGRSTEQLPLESLLATLVGEDEVASTAHAFLEENSGVEVCQKMLEMWNSVRLTTQKVIALAAEVKTLQKDNEHLTINLCRAEEEVKVLFEENNILNEENKRLTRQNRKENHTPISDGKQTCSACKKSNKRKCSPKMSSLI